MDDFNEVVLMILTLEDFAVIFTMLSPVYYLSFTNRIKVMQLESRMTALELRLSGILKLSGD